MKINCLDVKNYNVLINQDNDCEQLRIAKQELEHYLSFYYPNNGVKKGSILVGFVNDKATATKLSELKSKDSFVIFTTGHDIVICGNSNDGTLYATYYFIENFLGVDWLTPDQEVFKEPNDVETIDVAYEFNYLMRYNHSYYGFDKVFRSRRRTTFSVGDTNDVPSYGGIRGLKYAFSWGLFGHTFEVLLPYEKYYVQHPEWYSFAPSHPGENHRYQICLTNPDVFKTVCDNAIQYLDKHPGVEIISISQNDSYFDFENNYCLCPNCKKLFEKEGAYSGVLLQFVNKVADVIHEKYPSVYVHTFAYHWSELTPKYTKPGEKVIVQFCSHLNQGFRFTDRDERALVEKRKVDSWTKICSNVFSWTYLIYFENYFYPIGNLQNIFFNTRYLARRGVKGMFQQNDSDYNPLNFVGLKSYLVSKMFTEPNMSYLEYMNYAKKYLAGYYGESSSKYIYKYLINLDAKYRYKSDKVTLAIDFFNDKQFIDESKALFEKALKVNNNETYTLRIKQAYCSLKYANLYYLYSNIKNDKDREEYKKEREKLVREILSYGVACYREGATIPNPNFIDYSKAPNVYAKKDKVINLVPNKETEWLFSGDNTEDSNDYGFKFKLLLKDDEFKVTVEVKDNDEFTNDLNMIDWAQDCVEIYLSEDFNRTNKNGPNDYMFRVNAHGNSYCRKPEKIRFSKAIKTEEGFSVELLLNTNILNNGPGNYGFEIMAHDFSSTGKYKSTSYWNSFKKTPVCDAPQYYGIINVIK